MRKFESSHLIFHHQVGSSSREAEKKWKKNRDRVKLFFFIFSFVSSFPISYSFSHSTHTSCSELERAREASTREQLRDFRFLMINKIKAVIHIEAAFFFGESFLFFFDVDSLVLDWVGLVWRCGPNKLFNLKGSRRFLKSLVVTF